MNGDSRYGVKLGNYMTFNLYPGKNKTAVVWSILQRIDCGSILAFSVVRFTQAYRNSHLARLDEKICRRRLHENALCAVADALRILVRSENPHAVSSHATSITCGFPHAPPRSQSPKTTHKHAQVCTATERVRESSIKACRVA